jgi:hypothetical protein
MSRRLTVRLWGAFAVVGLLALGAGRATADIIPSFDGVTGPVAGEFTYSYHADITADQTILTNDFLTIYDAVGLVPGSVAVNSGWAFTVQNVGINPPNVTPVDDPTVPNITISRTGGSAPGPVPSAIVFSFRSIDGPLTKLITFASQGHKTLDGTEISNVGQVLGPAVPTSTPEPASLALLGMGVPFALTILRRRGNKANVA